MIPGFYINLDKRVDRRDHFEAIKRGFPIISGCERMSAIEHKTNGAIGCGLSHIKALTKCLDVSDSEYFIIAEDDFFIFNHEKAELFQKGFTDISNNKEWDILVLTPRGDTISGDASMEEYGFFRIKNNQTTTGYIIKRHIIPVLIENLKESITNLIKGGAPGIYAIDQYWKRLQTDYRFYYFKKVFAGQIPCYSDVEKRNVNYNLRFIQQEFM